MSLSIDITKSFDRWSKKRDLSDPSKEGNSGGEPKKIREEKSSIESLSEISDNVFGESLKSPVCAEILFNCLRNVEKEMKEIQRIWWRLGKKEWNNRKPSIGSQDFI